MVSDIRLEHAHVDAVSQESLDARVNARMGSLQRASRYRSKHRSRSFGRREIRLETALDKTDPLDDENQVRSGR